MSVRHLSSALVAVAVAGAPAAATAASVRLHVQAPIDLTTKKMNLEYLEAQNLAPVFGRTFLVPYDTLEPTIANMLEDVVGRNLHFYVKCTGLGIDELCPDTDITVKIHSGFKFTKKGQPVVTQIGPASDNKFRVSLDLQARISLDAAIHHETGIWYSGSETVDLFLLLGGRASVDLTLWPTPAASNLKVELKREGGNIDIDGLSGQIIGLGAVTGAVLLGPVGAAFGAILGAIGAGAAEDAIKDAINDAIDDQLSAANVQLRELVQAQIDPAVAQVVDWRDRALGTPIPGVGMTVAQALAVGPASIDVRTRATADDVRVVATTRFDPTPKGKSLQGAIRFPKTTCRYAEGGSKMTGHFKFPLAVDPINADLAGTSCASLIHGGSFARSTYLGESPDKLLGSGDPANALPSWQATGGVSTTGDVVDKGDYWECPYTVSNLPGAAILDLGSVQGTPLADRLDAYAFRTRVLFFALAGPTAVFDAEGKPRGTTLVFGGKGPKTTADCPSSHSGGTGLRKDKLAQLKDKFDPDKCPTCGLLDVFNVADIYSRPGKDVVLDPVLRQSDVTRAVQQAQAEFAGQGALEGVQRVQKVLDSGLLTRSWANVDKARGVNAGARGKTVVVKQVGPAAARDVKLKVFGGGQALPQTFTRRADAALPKLDVEVKLQGKGKATH
jgi:hypothetical protein